MNWIIYNVVISGLGFMLIFTSFYAASGSAKFVTDSLKTEINNVESNNMDAAVGDGYISAALVYALNAITKFLAPTIVTAIGHKIALVRCGYPTVNAFKLL